jgi:hypothetical protein
MEKLVQLVALTAIAVFSSKAVAQDVTAVETTWGDNPQALTPAQILKSKAKTSCLIHEVADKAELQGKSFRNNVTGTLNIGQDLRTRLDNQKVTFSEAASIDNKLPVRIGTESYLLIMEKSADQIDIQGGILRVGTKLRFEPGRWTSLLGAQYRGGEAIIGTNGLEISTGTEKRDGGAMSSIKAEAGQPRLDGSVGGPKAAELAVKTEDQQQKATDSKGFALQGIAASGVASSSDVTISQPSSLQGALQIEGHMETDIGVPGLFAKSEESAYVAPSEDGLKQFNLLGVGARLRFKGRVEIKAAGFENYVFLGDESQPLEFVCLGSNAGFVYSGGRGSVVLKNEGKTVALPLTLTATPTAIEAAKPSAVSPEIATGPWAIKSILPTITGQTNEAVIIAKREADSLEIWARREGETQKLTIRGQPLWVRATSDKGGSIQYGATGEIIVGPDTEALLSRKAKPDAANWFRGVLDFEDSSYTLVGKVPIFDFLFESSDNAPLKFRLSEGTGFTYVSGKGKVKDKDGNVLKSLD